MATAPPWPLATLDADQVGEMRKAGVTFGSHSLHHADLTALGYVAAATVLSLTLVWLALRFASDRSERSARALFLGSIAYLPLLWAVMILDH